MAVIGFCFDLCSRVMVWALAFLTLPFRPFTALYREIKLEEQLREMKTQLENLSDENKELEQCLFLAVKETNVVEKVFQEIEGDYEKAIAKISLLEYEIQDLKAQGKCLLDWKVPSEMRGSINTSWSSEFKEGLQDIMVHRRQPWSEDEGKERRRAFRKGDGESSSEDQKVVVAFQRSAFSAALSFLVGWIIWKAEDPCMPLVAALFTVVGMSLSSVVRFFSTIKNTAASGAVILLSINCFMLGTLSCPTLPRVALIWGPWAMRAADWFIRRLGFSS